MFIRFAVACVILILVPLALAACATDGAAARAPQDIAASVAEAAATAAQGVAVAGGSREDALDAAVQAAVSEALVIAPSLVSPQWQAALRTALSLAPLVFGKSPQSGPIYTAVYDTTIKELNSP